MDPAQKPFTLQDVADLQSDVKAQRTKRAAVDHLAEHYPHLNRAFLVRNLTRLVSIDPAQLVRFLGYPDPVGEEAVRNVLREAAP